MKQIQTLLTKNHVTSEYLCPKAQATEHAEEGTDKLGELVCTFLCKKRLQVHNANN